MTFDLDVIQLSLILLFVLFTLLGVGVWISISLLTVGWLGVGLFSNAPAVKAMANALWASSSSWTLAALPLFIWMGEILFRTKLSENLFKGVAPWVGWLPGKIAPCKRYWLWDFRCSFWLFRCHRRHGWKNVFARTGKAWLQQIHEYRLPCRFRNFGISHSTFTSNDSIRCCFRDISRSIVYSRDYPGNHSNWNFFRVDNFPVHHHTKYCAR